MATTEQLYKALQEADAAGDTEAAQYFAGQIKSQGSQHSLKDYDPIGGTAEAVTNMATGMVAKPLSDVAGLAGIVGDATGLWKNDPTKTKASVQNALTYDPRSKAGQVIAEYNPLALIGQGVGYVSKNLGDRIKDPQGEYPIASEMAGDFITEAIPQALSIAGTVAGSKVPARQAKLNTLKAQNAAKDATAKAAADLGIKFDPSTRNASLSTRLTEFLSGRPELNSLLSANNADKVNAVGRRALGLADDASLDPHTFTSLRNTAGQAHEALRGEGKIAIDSKLFDDLDALESKWTTANKSFPLTKNPAKATLDELRYSDQVLPSGTRQPLSHADADGIVSKIQDLRDKADAAYADPATKHLGKVYKGAAKALEDQLERGLTVKLNKMNPASMQWAHFFDEKVANFRKAREDIARSYAVQSAMDGSDLSAVKLASQLAKGKPLTGELKTIAETGKYFPNAVRVVSKSNASPVSFADVRAGGTGTTIGAGIAAAGFPIIGAPIVAGSIIGRPALRHFQASKFGQKHLAQPNYKASYLGPGAKTLSGLDALSRIKDQEVD
jgi:hypothetical protein